MKKKLQYKKVGLFRKKKDRKKLQEDQGKINWESRGVNSEKIIILTLGGTIFLGKPIGTKSE